MAKYGPKTQEEVEKALHKHKTDGYKIIKGRKQAIAIGLSEARRKGYKVPPPSKKSRR